MRTKAIMKYKSPEFIEFISETIIAASISEYRAAGVTEPGWYFWDETWAYAFGPYECQICAKSALYLYCRNELGE